MEKEMAFNPYFHVSCQNTIETMKEYIIFDKSCLKLKLCTRVI